MKRYRVIDDRKTYTGTAEEIVQIFATDTWAPAETTDTWMHEAAGRARKLTGCAIRTDRAEHFLQDLARAGFIELWEQQ